MNNEVVESGKPAGTCHSGSCTKQGTHRLDWDTWANLACDEHTASWRHVTSPDGTPVKVTPLFRCACCIADADPEGECETERWNWLPEFRQKVRATPFVNGNGLVGEYRGQYGAKHRVLVTERGQETHGDLATENARLHKDSDRVRALHERRELGNRQAYCDVCSNHGDITWPCATVHALNGTKK